MVWMGVVDGLTLKGGDKEDRGWSQTEPCGRRDMGPGQGQGRRGTRGAVGQGPGDGLGGERRWAPSPVLPSGSDQQTIQDQPLSVSPGDSRTRRPPNLQGRPCQAWV